MRGIAWSHRPRRISVGVLLLVVALLLGACGAQALPTPQPTSGVTYALTLMCPSAQPTCNLAGQTSTTEQVLLRRVKSLGYDYASVKETSPGMLQITIPGASDSASLKTLLTEPGMLTFLDTGTKQISVGTLVQPGLYTVAFTGAQLDPSTIHEVTDEATNQPTVTFAFAGNARQQFDSYTSQHIGDYLTIALDNTVLESAQIQSEIATYGNLSGVGSTQQAQFLAAELQGALPLSVTVTSVQSYGGGV